VISGCSTATRPRADQPVRPGLAPSTVAANPGGGTARVQTGATDSAELQANLSALPGFGEMKIKALGAVLAKRFGLAAAQDLVPAHPTLGDVDSAQALHDYQSAKRAHKAEWMKEGRRS
jgi:hypothetical protein